MLKLISLAPALVFTMLWLALLIHLRRRHNANWTRLLLTAIFGAYLYAVLDITVLQYQSLLLLKLFEPNLILRGVEAGEALNLIPLITLSAGDAQTSLLNILMLVPFGLGLPMISRKRIGQMLIAAALFSLAIETLQFITGQLAGTTFRVADINDLIFNTTGAAFGYLLFIAVVQLTRKLPARSNPLLRHITGRPQL